MVEFSFNWRMMKSQCALKNLLDRIFCSEIKIPKKKSKMLFGSVLCRRSPHFNWRIDLALVLSLSLPLSRSLKLSPALALTLSRLTLLNNERECACVYLVSTHMRAAIFAFLRRFIQTEKKDFFKRIAIRVFFSFPHFIQSVEVAWVRFNETHLTDVGTFLFKLWQDS